MRNNQASYVCPTTKQPLRSQATEQNGQIIAAGKLISDSGTSFPIVDGILDSTQNGHLSEPAAAVRDYLGAFSGLELHIVDKAKAADATFQLGASYWSSVLAAYCPKHWDRVNRCVVVGSAGDERFLDKRVVAPPPSETRAASALVLATGPPSHAALRERLSNDWGKIVGWDEFLSY